MGRSGAAGKEAPCAYGRWPGRRVAGRSDANPNAPLPCGPIRARARGAGGQERGRSPSVGGSLRREATERAKPTTRS